MSVIKIITAGKIPERKKCIDEFIDIVEKFPERNIIKNLTQYLSKFPKGVVETSCDGTIKINTDLVSTPRLIEIHIACNVSNMLRVWSPIKILSYSWEQAPPEHFSVFVVNSRHVTVGTIQYRNKSRGMPQYVINAKGGDTILANDFNAAILAIINAKPTLEK